MKIMGRMCHKIQLDYKITFKSHLGCLIFCHWKIVLVLFWKDTRPFSSVLDTTMETFPFVLITFKNAHLYFMKSFCVFCLKKKNIILFLQKINSRVAVLCVAMSPDDAQHPSGPLRRQPQPQVHGLRSLAPAFLDSFQLLFFFGGSHSKSGCFVTMIIIFTCVCMMCCWCVPLYMKESSRHAMTRYVSAGTGGWLLAGFWPVIK